MASLLSFSASISTLTIPNTNIPSKKPSKCFTQARKLDIPMVPTKDLMKNINGKKVVVNGKTNTTSSTSSSTSKSTLALVKVEKTEPKERQQPPFMEEAHELPSDEGFTWARDDYNTWQRTVDIWSFVLVLRLRFMFDNAKWTYVGGFSDEKQRIRRKLTACWLRERLLQLGPTFIKLGQLISSRSDLFPKGLVDELSKLQDRVPAFSSEKARGFIEQELGAPVDVLFKVFEDRPIAAASLGQVHRAVLHNGERVIVKVQRPGLKKLLDIDIGNLKLVAEYFQRSETHGGPSRNWIGIYEECSKILYQEIDYINEGKNADRFRRDFRNVKWVRVPFVLWNFSSTKVLTLEYVPGIKINNLDQIDARGYSRSQIASHAIEAYLMQVLHTGFFHADPHPGNLAIDNDGALIYYDFGMMGEVKSFTRDRLLELFYAVYEKDANKVIKCLVKLEALQPTGDMSPVRRSIQFFLENSLVPQPEQPQNFASIGEDLLTIATDQTFRLPSTFAFVLRAFSTLEGIGYTLDPEFSVVKLAAPFAQEILEVRHKQNGGSVLVDEIRKQVDDAGSSAISMPYRIRQIEQFLKQLELGDLKLRVRVLESERAARKATILQMATIYTGISGTLMNVAVTLSSQGKQGYANGFFAIAGVFFLLFITCMQGAKNHDNIEKMLK